MPVRAAAAVVWIALAWWAQHSSVRPLFAYTGAIVACVHLLGAIVGFAVQRVQGGWDFSGLAVGALIGIVCGIFAGRLAAHSAPIYWAAQTIAAAFVVYLPLVSF
jgi:hypothetical protein